MGLIAAVIVGIISGWLAGEIVVGGGFGLIGNLVLGVIGAVVGGVIMQAMGKRSGQTSLLGSILVATLGAVVVLLVANVLF